MEKQVASEDEIQAMEKRITSTALLNEICEKKILKLQQSSAAVCEARQQQREKLLQEIRGLQAEVKELQKKSEEETRLISAREREIWDMDNEISLLQLNGDSMLTAVMEMHELFEKTKRDIKVLYREAQQLSKTKKKKK